MHNGVTSGFTFIDIFQAVFMLQILLVLFVLFSLMCCSAMSLHAEADSEEGV